MIRLKKSKTQHRFLVFTLLLVSHLGFTQPIRKNDMARLESFGKVWGFLKYYHPVVSRGKLDWDTVLTNNYDRILSMKTNKEFNQFMVQLIDNLGVVKPCENCQQPLPDSLKRNLNILWMKDTSILAPFVSKRLIYIYENYGTPGKFYVKRQKHVGNPIFPNEKKYSEVLLPGHAYRFLAFCRFWNLINYYYPYRYLLKDWDSQFIQYIPRLYNTTTDYFYYRSMQELATHLKDSHGFVVDRNADYFSKRKIIPFHIRKLDSAYYIVRFVDTSLCVKRGLHLGDRILKINGSDIDLLLKHYARFQPASNQSYLDYQTNLWLSISKTDSSEITIERNQQKLTLTIPNIENDKKYLRKFEKIPWKLLNDSVGYIHMGFLHQKDIDPAFKKLGSTKYLIIDSRNYPNWTLYPMADKLLSQKTVFATIAEPDYDHPGLIKWVKPMVAGKKNPHAYTGKVLFLVNTYTMSQAEITVMALRNTAHPVVIGTQTAGAFGDVSKLPLPGGIDVYFSGLGYYYPNGEQIHQIGIIPDIPVETTLKGVLSGRDEILDRAFEYIKNGQ